MFEAETGSRTGTHPLDALIHHALSGRQRRFAMPTAGVLRFPPEVAPFAAMPDTTPASFEALRESILRHGPAALTTVAVIEPPTAFTVLRRATLLQMIGARVPESGRPEPALPGQVRLGARDVPDMLALTAATRPGPFGPRTIELGTYLGVRRQGALAALAGERLQIDGYAEISAVCVDPGFRGQGLATGLMARLMALIRARGEVPILHVLTSNHHAISLYRTLGFVVRREVHLTVLGRAAD
ncbi:GNAT family N-acetyltransferase [Burkholderia perseverans]|uniref:GNAT family N-acetyltransferase n=1 Tax=Burkholderia perseverans TaxID=2615214 RepID=UPI001FED68F1|nr:GNAT family N-acetyltransferase [Burkholderia perseverans]